MSNDKIKTTIEKLIKVFQEEKLDIVTRAVFKGNDTPSDKWSFCNRLIMYVNGTDDARGYKQWQEVGRNVKTGSKAFYIIGPLQKKITVSVTDSDTMATHKEDKLIITGFRAIPVFRIEDTEGAPIIKEEYNINIPYEFDGIIQDLGLKVGTISFNGRSYGYYIPGRKEIKLATPEIETFLHELSHAVDDKLHGLKGGQHNDQEVTAEFSAAVIAQLMGYKVPLGNCKQYIEAYDFKEIFKCLARIEKVVTFIIEKTTVQGVKASPCAPPITVEA